MLDTLPPFSTVSLNPLLAQGDGGGHVALADQLALVMGRDQPIERREAEGEGPGGGEGQQEGDRAAHEIQ